MNWLLSFVPAWNGWLALFLYWLPLLLCVYCYAVRAASQFAKDRAARAAAEAASGFYHPTITVGSLVGAFVLAITPIVNLFCAVFDAAPEVFEGFIEWCRRALNIPLVPSRRRAE